MAEGLLFQAYEAGGAFVFGEVAAPVVVDQALVLQYAQVIADDSAAHAAGAIRAALADEARKTDGRAAVTRL